MNYALQQLWSDTMIELNLFMSLDAFMAPLSQGRLNQ